MTTAYVWHCACGLTGKGEAAAQRHVNDDGCTLMGRPVSRGEAALRQAKESSEAWGHLVKRFMGYVAVRDGDECWEWQAGTGETGYGRFTAAKGVDMKAHRAAFFITHGWLPPEVMHVCDNPPCVRPAHLKAGTHADNMRDMAQKGRSPWAKLTPESTQRIRDMHTSGASQVAIARELDVSRATVQRVLGRPWHNPDYPKPETS